MDCPSRRFSCSLPCLIIRAKVNRFQVTMDTMEKPIEANSTPECQPRLGDAARRPLPKQIKKRDRSSTNFRKRWRTLVKTGCELHQDYGARVYFSISIPRTRKDFVFRSGKEISLTGRGGLVFVIPTRLEKWQRCICQLLFIKYRQGWWGPNQVPRYPSVLVVGGSC